MAQKKKVRSGKGWAIFAVVVSVITLVALVLGICTDWYTNFGKFGKKKIDPPTAEAMYAPGAGMLINQTSSDGIMLLSAEMPIEEFETYSLTTQTEAVKTITAQFVPADTTLQEVDYTIAWKNTTGWASGKEISDYITISQSSDGSLDCAVSVTQPFGMQAIITCTARPLVPGDQVPSATCTVDYYKRYENIKLIYSGYTYDSEGERDGEYSVTIANGATISSYNYYTETEENGGENTFNTNESIITTGTITDNIKTSTLTVKVSIADEIADSIRSAAGVSALGTYNVGTSNGLRTYTAICEMLGGENNVNNHRVAIYNAFKAAYDSGRSALKFEIGFTTQTAGFEYSFINNVKLNPMALGIKATGLQLPGGIIF